MRTSLQRAQMWLLRLLRWQRLRVPLSLLILAEARGEGQGGSPNKMIGAAAFPKLKLRQQLE
eukprot:13898165-Alexandrium_andersonii.AAC.1